MKKIFSLFILLVALCANSFAITNQKFSETVSDILVLLRADVNYKVEFLRSDEFEQERNLDFGMDENVMSFTRLYERGNGDFAYGIIYIRKEVMDMTDEFFDKHFAYVLAHEFIHIYVEQYMCKNSPSHGKNFRDAQQMVNDRINSIGKVRFFKYEQPTWGEPYDAELTEYFNKYKRNYNK